MDLQTIVDRIDASTARAFVTAARHVIDAMLIEAERVRQTQTPGARDYDTASLPRETPAGGWLSHDELRQTTQKMSEAIATEKWKDGMLLMLRILAGLGGV